MPKPKKHPSLSKPRDTAAKKRDHAPLLRHFMAIGLIAGVAFVAYSNTFSVPFLFDDQFNIIHNPNIHIKVFTWDHIAGLIYNTYAAKSIRFFSYFTLALNYYFGGLNVFGYHLVNFFIHVFSGIFLYGFLMLTFHLPCLEEKYGSISYKVALFTSLIFISHPIQTQSVTYIVQRMTSMAGMFYLLTLVLYIKGRLTKGKSQFFYFGGAVLSYLLGVFSKEVVVILPFFVALYEFYFFQNLDLGPRGKKILLGLMGALLLFGAFGFLLWGKRYINFIVEGYQLETFTMSERGLTQFRVVLYYLTLLVYPHPSRLNVDYDFPTSKSILDPVTTMISMVVILGLIGYSFWVAKRRPILSFCILWYFGNLVIESSILPIEMIYEHRLYLPSIGPFTLFGLWVVQGIEKLKERSARKKVLEWEKGK
jgi:hypothetical protein